MARILKYEIPQTIKTRHEIMLPKNSIIVHLGAQNGHICLWVESDEEDPSAEELVILEVINTGWAFNKKGKYHLGSVQMGNFIWHIYEVYEE